MGNTQAIPVAYRNGAMGGGMSQRRGSISWNFRYSATRSSRRNRAFDDSSIMMIYNAKLSIIDWLQLLDLQQYAENLQMYDRVDDILELNDNDLKAKGIRNSVHRLKMLSSLVKVQQAKRCQSMNFEVTSDSFVDLKDDTDFCETQSLYGIDNTDRLSSHQISNNSMAERRHTLNMIYEELTPLPASVIKSNSNNKKLRNMDNSEDSDSGSAPIQTSGDANISNSTPLTTTNEQQEAIALKKALEWELSLDSRDLRSHAWYHGPLARQRAEEIVQREGDFLIRDCASQPDNYVLTCRTKTSVLHFVINKILLQPETVYERVQYQFEEDAFDAIPDLITFYVGSDKPISAASGARIQFPCNRIYPLSFYGHKIVGNQLHTQMLAGIRGISPLNSPLSGGFRFGGGMTPTAGQQSQPHSPMSSPPRTKRDLPPRLPSKKQRSQSLTPAQAMVVSNMKNSEQCSSTDVLTQENLSEHNLSSGSSNSIHGESFKGGTLNSLTGRRFSNFEKSSSSAQMTHSPSEQQLPIHLERLPQTVSGKIVHTNGFQTIARCSVGDVIDHIKFTTHSLPRPSTNSFRNQFLRTSSSLARDFSMEAIGFNSSLEGKQIPELPEKPPSPPPKPIRSLNGPRKDKDSLVEHHRAGGCGYHASGSDSGNGSGDSVHSSIPGDSQEFTVHRGVIIKNPRFMSNSTSSSNMLKSLIECEPIMTEDQLFMMDIPEWRPVSKFDIENFSTLLLPSVENKPLDGDALNTFKMMLLETGPKMIAEHITRIDIGLLIDEPSLIDDDADDENDDNNEDDHYINNELDCCGLELLTLPQGKIFRNNLIERTQCIKLMVAVTILTCQTDLDRAELLSKWIQIAVETKTALGNLFGFCAIMLGLCMQQIQKLDQAWHILRQKYTDSAFTFEAKLRPTLISMNECSNPQAPNTTVPHVLLYVLLKDRPVIDILSVNSAEEKSSLYTMCVKSWESKAEDFGMTINFLHLDSARYFLRHLNLFRKNAKTILEESSPRMDELLSDAFRTEFHVKFLWGSNGASASPEDRHTKLEKVLALMADKFCNVDTNTSATPMGV